MEDDNKTGPAPVGQKTRRAFVKTAAQVAVTAPAVAMLLSASTKAQAAEPPYSNPGPLGDDLVIPQNDADGTDDGGAVVLNDDFGF